MLPKRLDLPRWLARQAAEAPQDARHPRVPGRRLQVTSLQALEAPVLGPVVP